MDIPATGFMSSRRLAVALAVSDDTVRAWRRRGCGPAYARLPGNLIRYDVRNVRAWLAEQTHQCTAHEMSAT